MEVYMVFPLSVSIHPDEAETPAETLSDSNLSYIINGGKWTNTCITFLFMLRYVKAAWLSLKLQPELTQSVCVYTYLCDFKHHLFVFSCVRKGDKSVKLTLTNKKLDQSVIVEVIFQDRRSIILCLQLSSVFALFYVFP